MTNASWRRQGVVFIAIAIALVGIVPFANPGCGDIYVIDATTGELRPASEDEAKALVEGIGIAAKAVTVAIGQPQYVIFIDLAVRVVALAVGFLYGRKELAVKTVTQSAASP